jgi:hypothetical protein
MTFKDQDEAILHIKNNLTVSGNFTNMRNSSKELTALVNGDDFIDLLIDKIDGIESDKKAKARQKYSRNIKDLFRRLFQPIDNIYYATGGVKDYDVTSKETKDKLLKTISSIRDSKPLSEWIQHNAIQLMNTDPNGLIFLEYTTTPTESVYPTYKSINSVRYYKEKGQSLEYVIFEPIEIKDGETTHKEWRVVDDKTDYCFKQNGEDFTLIEDKTFDHPFGSVPALICSNITTAGKSERLSSIEDLIGAAKEYARDQSFLTLYKIYKGSPIFWKYVSYCGDCKGTGKTTQGECKTCDGHGKYVGKNDVTDVVELPAPDNKDTPILAPNIAGFISPDLDVWKQYNEELKKLEELMYKTHWGTSYGMQDVQGMKTATEVTFDKQPLENQLNKYADYVEHMEWRLSELILNFLDPAKAKEESKITINLGRRYIIESYDVLIKQYEESKEKGENSVILDKLFAEYLGAKYRNNPIDLQINLVKARVEPYLHLPLKIVFDIFGNEEAQRKVLFQKWWQTVTDFNKKEEALTTEFNTWFETNKKTIPTTLIQ